MRGGSIIEFQSLERLIGREPSKFKGEIQRRALLHLLGEGHNLTNMSSITVVNHHLLNFLQLFKCKIFEKEVPPHPYPVSTTDITGNGGDSCAIVILPQLSYLKCPLNAGVICKLALGNTRSAPFACTDL